MSAHGNFKTCRVQEPPDPLGLSAADRVFCVRDNKRVLSGQSAKVP
jgi:hypothetical protein